MDPQETSLFIGVVISSVLLIAGISGFAYLYNRKNKMFFETKQKAEVSLLENERNRIGFDLHDEMMPKLMMDRLRINEMIKTGLAPMDKLIEIEDSLKEVITGMRDIISKLSTIHLAEEGLGSAVNDFICRVRDLHRVCTSYEYRVLFDPGEEMSIQIYRMVHELVQNTVKHSGASQIQLLITGTANEMDIEYCDNGCGFNADDKKNGLGLRSLRERTVLMGGIMHFDPVPGKGTRYLIKLPLKHESD